MNTESAPSSHHRLLTAARAVWLIYAVGLLAIYLASLPGYFERVTAGAVPDISFDIAWPNGNAYFTARATAAGLTVSRFLVANFITSLFVIAVHYTVAALIFWRLPRSWFGLLSAFVILLTGSAVMEDARQVAGLMERLGPVVALIFNLGALVWPMFLVWLYLFPDGRAVPRWARWPLGIIAAIFAAFMLLFIVSATGLLPVETTQPLLDAIERSNPIVFLVFPGILLALLSQIYRYWRVSGPVERQQTKWFVFGVAVFVAVFPLTPLVPFLARIEAINGSLILAVIPLTVGIALLRYRLWDVDVVIRRTVGYAILTSLLILVYFGSIVVLQRLLAPFTGDSTLATILSTLLIAALFLPLRRRIQDLIDRRFYRRKYDAAKVLERFAATARDETDLEKLTAELLRVIQEAMEPESVSIWLKPATDRRPATDD